MRGYGYRPLASLYPRPGWVEQDPHLVARTVAEAMTLAVLMPAFIQPLLPLAALPASAIQSLCGMPRRDNHWATPLPGKICAQPIYTVPCAGNSTRKRCAIDWAMYRPLLVLRSISPGACSTRRLSSKLPKEVCCAQAFRLNGCCKRLARRTRHAMDYSLVQAMGLFDFRKEEIWETWRQRLAIPHEVLPSPRPTVYDYGIITVNGPGEETGDSACAGDDWRSASGTSSASTVARPGDAECTHGTASFVNVCLGNEAPVLPQFNVYYGWVLDNKPTYCLEARTTATGSVLRWLRDEARFFSQYQELDDLVGTVPDAGGVIFVPAFSGLYDPYDDLEARGAIMGLTFGHTRAHIMRAFLESLGFQIEAILDKIRAATDLTIPQLILGGGISSSNAACQIQADLLGIPTVRQQFAETTARAAALLAGIGSGQWSTVEQCPAIESDRAIFAPGLSRQEREERHRHWQQSVARVANWSAS